MGTSPTEAWQFWQRRFYDFNVWNRAKLIEKLKYMHRNPVVRGLVARPEDWPWSSFRHYAMGEIGPVEIESDWTALHRERKVRVMQAPSARLASRQAGTDRQVAR
jgi:putative transposase